MTYAYIDRTGRRVEVQSFEGLVARLELGAILPSTLVYNPSEDRWAPAAEHEFLNPDPSWDAGSPPKLRGDRDGDATEGPAIDSLAAAPRQAAAPPGAEDSGLPAQVRDVPEDVIDDLDYLVRGLDPDRNPGAELPDPGERSGTPALPESLPTPSPSGGLESESTVPSFAAPASREEAAPEVGAAAGPAGGLFGELPPELASAAGTVSNRPSGSESRRRPAPPPPLPRSRKADPTWRRFLPVVGLAAALIGLAWFWSRDPVAETSGQRAARPGVDPRIAAAADDLVREAWAGTLEDLGGRVGGFDLPEGPGPQWLQGSYLASAGDYPEEGTYWASVWAGVRELREAMDEVFLLRLESIATAEGSGLPASRQEVVEEALALYEEADPGRAAVFDLAERVAMASRDLHDLLVIRQDDIAYEPFSRSTVSRDPVLEAVPGDPLLAQEMWTRIDEITRGLQDLNALLGVSTERFFLGLLTSLPPLPL